MNLPCGCCKGAAPFTPLVTANRPGLTALKYRIGTYASFFETMKARLSGSDLRTDSGAPPLSALKTREPSDPAIALLDAWAIVADVLTFYQERIANEGYLRTALERQSVLELARLVNYELRPGVAASVYLAYTLEQNSAVTIPPGSRAQNMPGPGELPQSFETGDAVDARGAWNNLAPRLTRPQVVTPAAQQIYVAGVTANLKPNDPMLIVSSPPAPRRVASVDVEFQQNRTRVRLQDGPAQAGMGSSNTPTPFERVVDLVAPLSKPPAGHPPNSLELQRSVSTAFKPEMDTTPAILKTFNPQVGAQLYAGLKNAPVTLPASGEFHALRVQTAPFGHNAPLKPITNANGAVVGTEEWPLEGSVGIKISISRRSEAEAQAGWFSAENFRMLITQQSPKALVQISTPDASASAPVVLTKDGTPTKVGQWDIAASFDPTLLQMFFNFPGLGHSYLITFDPAVQAMDVTVDSAQVIQVPIGESSITQSLGRRTFVSAVTGILIDDQSALPPPNTKVLTLDSVYDQILPGSWVLIERADTSTRIVTRVNDVQKVSVTNYGMSTRVTQLTLADPWLDAKRDLMLDVARSTAVSAQSEQLTLAEEPMDEKVAGGRIELGNLYGDLQSGRWLVVEGERTDIGTSGVTAAELVMLANVEQGVQQIPVGGIASSSNSSNAAGASTPSPVAMQDLPGDTTHSFLHLSSPLSYAYKRDTVTIYGNVVQATHGETRKEVLGSGDGGQELQQFSLHSGPLTHVPATTPQGTQSTLSVRVNDVLWHEVDTLAGAGPTDRVYITRTDDNDKTTIIFGNGKNGMRLPTGLENVMAGCRSGIGSGGNVVAKKVSLLATRPLGVKNVINPLPSTGGADRDTADQGRRNAPTMVAALDRLVSVSDYGDFARTFAGIGKANSVSLSNGHRQVVFVTIAGAEGAVVDKTSALYSNLIAAFQELGDPNLPTQVEICEFMLLVISAKVKVLPDYHWNSVAPQIRARMLDTFSFDRSELGESLPLSVVVSTIQGIPGVQYVEVQILDSISESDTANPDRLKAKLAEIATATAPKASIDVPAAWLDPTIGAIQPAGLVFLSPDLPDTLILTEITA